MTSLVAAQRIAVIPVPIFGVLHLKTAMTRTAELLADRGYAPMLVDISELEKLECSVTCLSVRLRGR